jgi:hypothetical protein
MNGTPKYFTIYEHENEHVREKEEYKNVLNTAWAKRIRAHLINFKKVFLKRI